ncbi:nucleoside/nucleotide kinase family protein [Jiella sp. MQZ9-1]|uniref:Nucleoside/nucleotide kinase family protein n=1 Tax=Jiella flava TaxID=2816857 RepID=A0A939FYK3_9HYPH|nr:nucleoside/nucleotide kinase family protein [Jiella flava]MBO0663106.1 nucleoside/nucleotide kinase family protein [Jiella flava]MCD2471525.1 nucleoside/nucleotide kinase family protein [Jiella flava]
MAEEVRTGGTAVSREAFLEAALALGGTRRKIVAVAGAPGAGKSTLADWLVDAINARQAGSAAVLPMDGYHYDDRVLEARGDRPRKGAPHTFDVDGLAVTLARLAADDGRDVAVPVFDRSIEIARAGARIITPEARLIVAEGNYLLLDEPAWAPLRASFALTAMLDVPEPILRQRLLDRWLGFGLAGDALTTKLEGNDFINMRTVLEKSIEPDMRIM